MSIHVEWLELLHGTHEAPRLTAPLGGTQKTGCRILSHQRAPFHLAMKSEI
jgi:hypothetical protein